MTTCRVYWLDIIYPEGSHSPGWRPLLWSDPDYLQKLSRKDRRDLARREFRWPRERRFLSSSGAYGRAWLLRAYGADVEVLASNPVTWPDFGDVSANDAQWERGSTASRWFPELDDLAVYSDGDLSEMLLHSPGFSVEEARDLARELAQVSDAGRLLELAHWVGRTP
jgi:hypothetical protein